MSEYERTPQDIEREIEATRERMSRDIDELGDRLSPDNLKRQAKDAITGKAHEMVSNVGAGARRTGFRMMDFIQENTSLVAAMGLGAVWLIQQRNRSEISGDRMARFAYTGPERRGSGLTQRIADRAGDVRHAIGSAVGSATETVSERAGELREQARDRAGDLAERAEELGSGARERARDLGHQAREQTRRARGGVERLMKDNPLAVAAGNAANGRARSGAGRPGRAGPDDGEQDQGRGRRGGTGSEGRGAGGDQVPGAGAQVHAQ
jgi:ElaB/YqjD/DUF883 family membrane-anchored ribosome-binding protein